MHSKQWDITSLPTRTRLAKLDRERVGVGPSHSAAAHVSSPAILDADATPDDIKCMYTLWSNTPGICPRETIPGAGETGTRFAAPSVFQCFTRELRKWCADGVSSEPQMAHPSNNSVYGRHYWQILKTCTEGKKKEMICGITSCLFANFWNTQTQNMYFPWCAYMQKKSTQRKKVNWIYVTFMGSGCPAGEWKRREGAEV